MSEQGLQPGDLCRHGENSHPRYRVIHVHEGRVWLRDVDSGVDAVVDDCLCRKIADEAPAGDEPHHDAQPGLFSNPPGQPSGPPDWVADKPRP